MFKNKSKGFTLMELLVVIGIIVVLVAISIPIFMKQLEKSRETTDIANMRAAKAAIATAYLTEDITAGDVYYYDAENGKLITGTAPEGYGRGTEADAKQTYSVLSSCSYEPAEKSCTYVSAASYKDGYLTAFVSEDGEAHVHWVGASAPDPSKHKRSDLYDVFVEKYKGAKAFLVLNSNHNGNHDTINSINGALTAMKSDIKSWAIICSEENASDPKDPDTAYYLFSTYDTSNAACKKSGLTEGSQVPAIMQCPDGSYQVGYATLYHDDRGYYAFSRDANGNERNIKQKTNPDYDVNTVLSDKQTFNSLDQAYSYYNELNVRK